MAATHTEDRDVDGRSASDRGRDARTRELPRVQWDTDHGGDTAGTAGDAGVRETRPPGDLDARHDDAGAAGHERDPVLSARIGKVWALLEAIDEDDPLWERALQKFYHLTALDAGQSEDQAADTAWELITDWRWNQALAGQDVGIAPER